MPRQARDKFKENLGNRGRPFSRNSTDAMALSEIAEMVTNLKLLVRGAKNAFFGAFPY